jgi:GNAT superfamily N-acetyltransferase
LDGWLVNDIEIRTVTSQDAETACAVLVRSINEICAPYYEHDQKILAEWLANKTPSNVRQWIEEDRCYSVVAVNRRSAVVGFAMICGSEILRNYVLPEALYRGIGKRMLQALEEHAITAGVKQIKLVSSIPAKAFYERNGYGSNGPARYVDHVLGDFPLIKTFQT